MKKKLKKKEKAMKLFCLCRYPPCDLEDEVEARMKQLQDELVSRRNAAMKKYVNLAKPVSSGTPDSKFESGLLRDYFSFVKSRIILYQDQSGVSKESFLWPPPLS